MAMAMAEYIGFTDPNGVTSIFSPDSSSWEPLPVTKTMFRDEFFELEMVEDKERGRELLYCRVGDALVIEGRRPEWTRSIVLRLFLGGVVEHMLECPHSNSSVYEFCRYQLEEDLPLQELLSDAVDNNMGDKVLWKFLVADEHQGIREITYTWDGEIGYSQAQPDYDWSDVSLVMDSVLVPESWTNKQRNVEHVTSLPQTLVELRKFAPVQIISWLPKRVVMKLSPLGDSTGDSANDVVFTVWLVGNHYHEQYLLRGGLDASDPATLPAQLKVWIDSLLQHSNLFVAEIEVGLKLGAQVVKICTDAQASLGAPVRLGRSWGL